MSYIIDAVRTPARAGSVFASNISQTQPNSTVAVRPAEPARTLLTNYKY